MSNFDRVERLKFWCQKVIPLVYDNSLSYYEFLCKVCDRLNEIVDNQNQMAGVIEGLVIDVDTLQADVVFLKGELQKIANGEYMNVYIQALANWIDENLQELVARIVKYVFFGLDNNGHFVGYIPDSWNFIQFDTIVNDPQFYGHLKLTW